MRLQLTRITDSKLRRLKKADGLYILSFDSTLELRLQIAMRIHFHPAA